MKGQHGIGSQSLKGSGKSTWKEAITNHTDKVNGVIPGWERVDSRGGNPEGPANLQKRSEGLSDGKVSKLSTGILKPETS